jgi:hypothetical protein
MKLRNKETGEIIDSACIGVFKHQSSGDCKRVDTEARSLSKFLEQWEDYKPAEPLIKDEKIRKALRAWAEVLRAKEVEFYGAETWLGFRTTLIGSKWSSKFELDCPGSKNTLVAFRTYTIAELCGEEEE